MKPIKCFLPSIFVSLAWMIALSLFAIPSTTYASPETEAVIRESHKHKHKEYKMGENGPDRFDCSGFVQYVYKQSVNLSLPRTSQEQAQQGGDVNKNQLQKGDLLFFQTNGKSLSHVGIYLGDEKMIHAANERVDIIISNIHESYWKKNFVKAKRIIR